MQSLHIVLTLALTFIKFYLNLYVIRPLVLSYLLTSNLTLSPGNIFILNILIFPDVCPKILSPSAVSILNCALGKVSKTVPSISSISFLIAIIQPDTKKYEPTFILQVNILK